MGETNNWNTFKLRSHTIGTALSEPVPTACARVIHSFLIASTAITARVGHTVVHDCKKKKSWSSNKYIHLPVSHFFHNIDATFVLCFSLYFILTDLPTEIRKTSAMMKPAKEIRISLLLFHIIGVINKINHSTDLFVSPRTNFIDIFLTKINQIFTWSIVVVLCPGDH